MPIIPHNEQIAKLRDLVKDIDYCMLTTIAEHDDSPSRPMFTNGELK